MIFEVKAGYFRADGEGVPSGIGAGCSLIVGGL